MLQLVMWAWLPPRSSLGRGGCGPSADGHEALAFVHIVPFPLASGKGIGANDTHHTMHGLPVGWDYRPDRHGTRRGSRGLGGSGLVYLRGVYYNAGHDERTCPACNHPAARLCPGRCLWRIVLCDTHRAAPDLHTLSHIDGHPGSDPHATPDVHADDDAHSDCGAGAQAQGQRGR
jgi:hypothetical protein